jgi:hypothetical protein
MEPALNPYSSTLAFARVRLFAGGSRERFLILPPDVAFPLVQPILPGYFPLKTFPVPAPGGEPLQSVA